MSLAPQSIVYKESGIPWLGKIPKHWEMRRLASFGSFSKGGNISKGDLSDSGNSVILYGDIYTKYEIKTSNLKSKVEKDLESLSTPIYSGDILFAGSGETKEDIGKAVVYQGDEKAFAGGDIIIFRQVENNSLFLSYCLNSQYAKTFKAIESKGEIIVHIYTSNLRDLKIPLPPLQEQKAIADFLDKKTHQIEEFIAKKQKLITLLEEKKQTLINQCVTQGLDSSISLKDSGVEWLGKIPTHWEMRKIKHIASTNIGLVYSPNDLTKSSVNSVGILRSNNIQGGKINYLNLIYIGSEKVGKKQIVSIGDLLMCVRNGSEALVGKTAKITKNNFSFGAFMAIIRSPYNDYLYWIFQTDLLRKSIANFSVSIGIGQISQEDIKNFIFSFPPLEEQKAIAEYLDTQIAKIDLAISKIKSQINLIKEYKSTLISEAVCGRVGRC
ncbi:restriction endonuclease subunit S [Helicobacter brantae]|uniref:Restriction endonuclease subunit S n=1 Tax=Helicobacter brantae TaxID=375927 RepID=A0A3D8J2T5_9HELI|nr:restriction endonuclease subunit S [Helicobacter brantae]RDU71852.1 restriction endonuclease subunit S [Helicobacter brantae]